VGERDGGSDSRGGPLWGLSWAGFLSATASGRSLRARRPGAASDWQARVARPRTRTRDMTGCGSDSESDSDTDP
jgi:hypothetical protein